MAQPLSSAPRPFPVEILVRTCSSPVPAVHFRRNSRSRASHSDVLPCSSAISYWKLKRRADLLSGSGSDAMGAVRRRTGMICFATYDDIEAEKSHVENQAMQKLEKSIEALHAKFKTVRTGRTNRDMLDRIQIEYFGSPVALKAVAQISAPDGSTLLVQPYDKTILKAIEKAIMISGIGLIPINDGEEIKLSMPQLTSERRKELSRVVAKHAEEGKVSIRNIRRDAIKVYEKLEKEKKLSKDNVKDLSNDFQKLTDLFVKKIDSLYKQKEKELMAV